MSVPPAAKPNRLGVLGEDLAGFPNDRRLNDDVVDIELQALEGAAQTGKIVPALAAGDAVDTPYRGPGDTFPYVALPNTAAVNQADSLHPDGGVGAGLGGLASGDGFPVAPVTALGGGGAPGDCRSAGPAPAKRRRPGMSNPLLPGRPSGRRRVGRLGRDRATRCQRPRRTAGRRRAAGAMAVAVGAALACIGFATLGAGPGQAPERIDRGSLPVNPGSGQAATSDGRTPAAPVRIRLDQGLRPVRRVRPGVERACRGGRPSRLGPDRAALTAASGGGRPCGRPAARPHSTFDENAQPSLRGVVTERRSGRHGQPVAQPRVSRTRRRGVRSRPRGSR
ncbi:DUF4331 family protein [Streptomyces rubiginosohelvolus]|uniref:DUF4331 family protein n=1 Tax=Streptomyces rubiginosohelvolus TaxID=67362 RepID=UPI0035DC4875